MEIFSAFLIGLFGSFHCVGMCGPIALALPLPSSGNFTFFIGRIIYNLGRVITYSLLGLIIGYVGERLAVAGYQQMLSIILGGVFLLYLILPKKYKIRILNFSFLQKPLTFLKTKISSLFNVKSNLSFFTIGLLNGFLPCGFVYIGLAGAVATGSLINGMLFMMFFGLGTIPVMFAVSIFGKFISLNFRQKLTKLAPAFILFFAILFLLRGMNLGIPYVSPKIDSAKMHEMMHH